MYVGLNLSEGAPVLKRMVISMEKAENSVNRTLYKVFLILLKVIPGILALCYLLNTILGFTRIDVAILSDLGHVSILMLVFLYIVSAVFRFCIYQRMFLHYILATDILNYIDYYVGIPLDNRTMFGLYMIVAAVFLYLVLYFYFVEKWLKRSENSLSESSMI